MLSLPSLSPCTISSFLFLFPHSLGWRFHETSQNTTSAKTPPDFFKIIFQFQNQNLRAKCVNELAYLNYLNFWRRFGLLTFRAETFWPQSSFSGLTFPFHFPLILLVSASVYIFISLSFCDPHNTWTRFYFYRVILTLDRAFLEA